MRTLPCLLLLATAATAQPPIAELNPRPVQFPSRPLPLTDILKELEQQTGNKVLDTRSSKTNPSISLKTDTFWKTLDALGKQEGIAFSAYHEGGGVALVDGFYRPLKVHHSGLFRVAFKRIAVSRDEDTRTHTCNITLDIAWEPRLKLIYLGLDRAEVGQRKSVRPLIVEAQLSHTAAGASAVPLEFQVPAPDRSVAKIDYVKGTLKAIGAPKMLEFQFAKLDGKETLEKEGVRVALPALTRTPTRWAIDLATVYPKGAILPLESFQESDWMLNNRVWLSWTDAKGKTHTLEPTGWSPQFAKEGVRLRHEFEPRPGTPMPPATTAVIVHHTTPNRVVAFTVPFELQDLPLP